MSALLDSDKQRGQDPLFQVGEVVGTHGLRGDLKVKVYSGDPESLLTANEVVVEPPGSQRFAARVTRQLVHKRVVLLRLAGYEGIARAEALVGSKVMLPESALPELNEDEYFWGKLSGSRVIDRRHGELGLLARMFTTAAHDTYVVEGVYGEVLIPAVKEFIVAIDLDQRTIEVDLPDGLVPEQE